MTPRLSAATGSSGRVVSRRCRDLALLVVVLGQAIPAAAQTAFTTADGSRFLLLRTGGPELVHWAIASPAGGIEEPSGLEGVSRAVLLASMRGTASIGTLDPAAEQRVLTRIARLQQILRAGSGDAQSELELAAARMEAIRLRDPLAYLRVLAGTPAHRIEVRQTGEAGLLLLTTGPGSLPRVAELLWERRERNALRMLEEAMAEVRAEDRLAWRGDPLRAFRAEAIALCFAGHDYARAAPRPATAGTPTRDEAAAVWRRTQRPDRCLHVLTGNFEVAAVRQVLERAFSRTELAGAAPSPPAPPAWPSSIRRASVPGAGPSAVVVALRAPRSDPRSLRWALDLAAGGPRSLIAMALAARGHDRISVQWSGPVPPGRPGAAALVEVTAADGERDLTTDTLAVIRELATAQEVDLEPVRLSHQRLLVGAGADPRELAARLAAELLYEPDPAAGLRGLREGPSPQGVRAALRELLSQEHPVVVERGVAR